VGPFPFLNDRYLKKIARQSHLDLLPGSAVISSIVFLKRIVFPDPIKKTSGYFFIKDKKQTWALGAKTQFLHKNPAVILISPGLGPFF
jgi:hypothetical protein